MKQKGITTTNLTSIGCFFFGTLTGIAALIILTIIAIICGTIIHFGWERLSWDFITKSPEQGMTQGGIFPAIFGTALLVLLMTIIVVPFGVMTAIYLTEYAPKKSKLVYLIRSGIQNLAGVPSIIFGLFGLGFFQGFIGRGIDRIFCGGRTYLGQPALIWASLTMAVLTLPTVIVATEEALRSVPEIHREIAYALGATKWQVTWKVVLPQTIGGIMTGTILAISRGAGEVAPIMFTGAVYFLPYVPHYLNDQFMELGYHVYVLSTQSPDVELTKPILYSTVLVLLILTFILNFIAIVIRARVRRRLRELISG